MTGGRGTVAGAGPATVLLVPATRLDELAGLAHVWVANWLLDPFHVVGLGPRPSGAAVHDAVAATYLARDRAHAVPDLLEDLARPERSPRLLRVVHLALADGSTDELAALRGAAHDLAELLREAGSRADGWHVRTVGLIVAETGRRGLDLASMWHERWPVNVLADPEDRRRPGGIDTFVRRDVGSEFLGFALAHAAAAGGLWAGMTTAPYDEAALDGRLHVQRLTARGVVHGDLLVRLAAAGLRRMLVAPAPVLDPALRRERGPSAPRPLEDACEAAVAELARALRDDVAERPLVHRPPAEEPVPGRPARRMREALVEVVRVGGAGLRAVPGFTLRALRRRLRSRAAEVATAVAYGEDGAAEVAPRAVRLGPFDDTAALVADLADLADQRAAALRALVAAVEDGAAEPEAPAELARTLRCGADLLLDGDDPPGAPAALAPLRRLLDRSAAGIRVLDDPAWIAPDPRDRLRIPSPVAARVAEATGGELRDRDLDPFDADLHRWWAERLGALAAPVIAEDEALRRELATLRALQDEEPVAAGVEPAEVLAALEADHAAWLDRATRIDALEARQRALEAADGPLLAAFAAVVERLGWLERSVLGRVSAAMEEERRHLGRSLAVLASRLGEERTVEAPDLGVLLRALARTTWIGLAVAVVLGAAAWSAGGPWAGAGGALVGAVVPLVGAVTFHRRWSGRRRALLLHRTRMGADVRAVGALVAERRRLLAVHGGMRLHLLLLADLTHHPFGFRAGLLDRTPAPPVPAESLPASLRLATPVLEGWSGGPAFERRVVRALERPGWRRDARAALLAALHRRHGFGAAELTDEVLDREPDLLADVLRLNARDPEAAGEVGEHLLRRAVRAVAAATAPDGAPALERPAVREVRRNVPSSDARVDLLAPVLPAVPTWEAFLTDILGPGEPWSPELLDADRAVGVDLGRIESLVHLPGRLHGGGAHHREEPLAADEVGAVELVVRIDRTPEAVDPGQLRAFAPVRPGGVRP